MADLQQRYFDVLLEKVTECKYPSKEHMNRLEMVLQGEQREDYVAALIDKVEADRFPSIEMMNRIQGLLANLD